MSVSFLIFCLYWFLRDLTFISKCSWFIVFSFYIQVFRVLQKFYYHLNYLTLPVCNNKNCYWTLCVDSQSSQFSYPIQLTCFWLWKVCGEVITHNYKNLKVKAMILRMSNYAASSRRKMSEQCFFKRLTASALVAVLFLLSAQIFLQTIKILITFLKLL